MIQDLNVNAVHIEWKGYGVTVRIECPPGEISIGVVGEDPPPPLKIATPPDSVFDAAKAEPNRDVDAAGQTIEPTNLYAAVRHRAKDFLTARGVRFMVETQGNKFIFHFPDMDTIDLEVLDGLRAIFGTINFLYRCGNLTEAEKQEAEADREAFLGLEEEDDAP